MFYYPDCGIITSRARVVMSPVHRAMAVSPLKFVSMEFRTDKKFNSGTDPPPVIHSTVTAGRWWWRAYLVGSTRATDIHDPTILHPPFSTLPLPSSSIHHLTTSRAHHYLNVWTANRQSQHWSKGRREILFSASKSTIYWLKNFARSIYTCSGVICLGIHCWNARCIERKVFHL